MPETLRLILDPPAAATFNMAVDEVLMGSQREAANPPVLRIYSWKNPAYSIGYFQDVVDIQKRFECEKRNIPVVRRITGGGLVLHGTDLTFSLCLKDPNPFLRGDVKDSYLKINETLLAGFKPFFPGVDFADCRTIPSKRAGERVCFDSPSCYDILLNGRKVVGSSQRRKEGAILHQSSIFLEETRENLIQAVVEGFKKKWNVNFCEQPLTAEELRYAKEKEGERYSLKDWVFCPGR